MLALIAGQGGLPGALVQAPDDAPLVASLEGFTPDNLTPDITFRLETLGSLLTELKLRGVDEVCLAGAVRRPSVDMNAVDAATKPLVPVIVKALRDGDDGALRAIIEVFEQAGFAVRAAHEICPGLLPAIGTETVAKPTPDDDEEIIRAGTVLAALGAADIGQACVVHRGQILAVEAGFGTDWMLDSLAARPDGRGGLLFKAPKPGQDRRADLPVIGPDTVKRAAKAGLDGIVIEAGGVIVLDRAATIAAANDAGLFLWVRQP